MPTSTVKFTDFNIDPLPDPAVFGSFDTSFEYGDVVGTGNVLDTKDGTDSYVRVEETADRIGRIVTCRVVYDPPIPDSAIIPLDTATLEADFAAFQMQVAFVTAPTMPSPPSGISPGFIAATNRGVVFARDVAGSRDRTQPAWGTQFWDETDCNDTGGPAIFTPFEAIQQPGLQADYYVIKALEVGAPALLISQIVGRVTWETSTVLKTIGENFRSVGGAQIKSLIPGVGWVPVQRFG